jgi:4-amino-4-deoxy-L-arabinose transferase-like glycosyltransferase
MINRFNTEGSGNSRRWAALLILVLLAGFGFRALGAWCLEYAINADYGIVGLMAKHMAEGTDYPVFFYGQPYMGSFEPAISALLCRIMGVSGFAVCMGTGLLAFGLLPILYLWARDARDRFAGLAAILFSLIGSFAYFYHCAAPRGGYASTLVLGSMTVWLAGRIAMRAWVGEPVVWSRCLLLGLGAGLGWWSNQLVVPFLMAAALTLLIGLRGRVLNPVLILGGSVGFMAGSLPWWLWNVSHGWESLQFGGTLGQTPFAEGLGIFRRVFAELLEIHHKPVWVLVLLALAYGVLLVGYGLELRCRWRERSAALLPLLSPALVVVLMALVFATSHFARSAEVRYILPAFPAVAILVGIGTAKWVERTWLGWIPVLFLIAVQCHLLPSVLRFRTEAQNKWIAAAEISDFLKPQSIRVVYGAYSEHWMNLATKEALCVVGLDYERYAPYARSAAAAGKVAYFAEYIRVGEFIVHSGGTSESAVVAGYRLLYNVQPPSQDVMTLSSESIQTVVAGPSRLDVRTRLHDLDLDTGYAVKLEPPSEATLEWTFSQDEPLCGVRVFNPDGDHPRNMRIEGRQSGSTVWEPLLPWTGTTCMFWSGPRVYYQGFGYYLEYRFPARKYAAVRLSVSPGLNRQQAIYLGEVEWLQPGHGDPMADPAIDEIVGVVRTRHIERIYAPRWISEQVCQRARSEIETLVSDLFVRRVNDGQPELTMRAEAVEVTTRKTALLVYQQDAARTRACLARVGLSAIETALGPWILFDCQQGITAMGHVRPPLRWTDRGCFLSLQLAAKDNAEYWYRHAQDEGQAGTKTNRMDALRRAVEFYPAHQPALAQLADALLELGQTNESLNFRQVLLAQTRPAKAFNIAFAAGAQLLGVDSPLQTVRRGSSFPFSYYWQCSPDMKTDDWAVFAHFVCGKETFFQDDHVLLADKPPAILHYQPFPEVFRVDRTVQIPASVPPGDYRLRFGLYNRVTEKRCRPLTSLPLEHKAVWLPVTLHVINP